jgi:hypothetical protein
MLSYEGNDGYSVGRIMIDMLSMSAVPLLSSSIPSLSSVSSLSSWTPNDGDKTILRGHHQILMNLMASIPSSILPSSIFAIILSLMNQWDKQTLAKSSEESLATALGVQRPSTTTTSSSSLQLSLPAGSVWSSTINALTHVRPQTTRFGDPRINQFGGLNEMVEGHLYRQLMKPFCCINCLHRHPHLFDHNINMNNNLLHNSDDDNDDNDDNDHDTDDE